MSKVATDFLWLTLPITFAATALILAAVLKRGRALIAPASIISTSLIGYDIGGLFRHLPTTLVRILLCGFALLCLCIPSIRDYSGFFPRRFNIAVYFDEQGLRAALAQFAKLTIDTLNIPSDWSVQREQYFAEMNIDLKTIDPPFHFETTSGVTFGSGDGSLQVRKIDDEWQTYQITMAVGTLNFQTRRPRNETSERLQTEYILAPTGTIPIKVGLADIYLNFGVISELEFWQMVRRSPTAQPIHYRTLMALSRIKMLPSVNFGETIYLVPVGGSLIPLGYGIYTPFE